MNPGLELITSRPYEPNDRAFILASWLKGMYYGDSWFSFIPKNIFMAAYHNFLERLLDAPGVEIKVACLKEDPQVILGYAVCANTVIHWVFVKKAWRGIGVAKMLLPERVSAVTHLTVVGKRLLQTKLPGAVFNPFLC